MSSIIQHWSVDIVQHDIRKMNGLLANEKIEQFNCKVFQSSSAEIRYIEALVGDAWRGGDWFLFRGSLNLSKLRCL
jgi:hypothetical protein